RRLAQGRLSGHAAGASVLEDAPHWVRRQTLYEVELHTKGSVSSFTSQRISEPLARHDLHGPHIDTRRGNQRGCELVCIELLSVCTARITSVSTVLGGAVFSTVFMAVIVLQPQSILGLREYPRARAVVTYVQRNLHSIGRALAHMHNDWLPSKRGRVTLVPCRKRSTERLPAMNVQRLPELLVSRRNCN